MMSATSNRVSTGVLLRKKLLCAALTALTFAGCITPQNTRFPTFFRQHPLAERAAYERTDPLFDPAIGPSLDARPREFRNPRTIERRAAQNRLLQGISQQPESIAPFPSGPIYPSSVR